ncbi:MAG: hypothetical protein RLZZ210_434 [Pseudomonadota bacterium]|jgi:hypothetical protein
MNNLQEAQTKLSIIINNSTSVELIDFSLSMMSLSNEYERFIKKICQSMKHKA